MRFEAAGESIGPKQDTLRVSSLPTGSDGGGPSIYPVGDFEKISNTADHLQLALVMEFCFDYLNIFPEHSQTP